MRSLTRHLSQWRRSETGAVAVEFTLLAPMLFAMLFGIVCVGYAMALSHSVQQLATSAARASVSGITTAERRMLAEDYIANGPSHYPLLTASALSQAVDVTEGSAPTITVAISYTLDGSILELANGFLGLNLGTLDGRAYLAY